MTDNNDVQSARPSAGVSRRTVMKGAAWSAPLLVAAVAAPAYAASQCTPEASFDSLQVGSSPTSITFLPAGTPAITATLTYASNGQGGVSTPGNTGRVARTSTSPAWNYLEVQMVSSLNVGDWVELTIAFSSAVQGLSFIIHDIDKSDSPQNVGWVDNVVVSRPPANAAYTSALGGNIQGAGTTVSPFNPIKWGDTPIDGGLGRVRVTWPGSVTQVKVRYLAGATGDAQSQHIGIGNLSYDACVASTTRSLAARSAGEDVTIQIRDDTEGYAPEAVETDTDS